MEDNVGNNLIGTLIVISVFIAGILFLMWVIRPPTFAERFQPAIDHPLKQMSYARVGFCFPRKCRVV